MLGKPGPSCRLTKMTFRPCADQERGVGVAEIVEAEPRLALASEARFGIAAVRPARVTLL
jgi:hypothetical protein